ncbi:MAG: sigma-54 dependent transcriptional regulator [Myxococcota bacterium]
MKKTILLAQKSTYLLRRTLAAQDYDLLEVRNIHELKQVVQDREIAMIVLDLDLPGPNGHDGLNALRWLKSQRPPNDREIPVVTIGHQEGFEEMRTAHALGCHEHLMRPLDQDNLLSLIRATTELSQIIRQNVSSPAQPTDGRVLGLNQIIGASPSVVRVKTEIRQVAPHNSAVMFLGESGTGKEMAARAVHLASTRSNGPFIAINCISIPDSLAESLLFGHKKGAFTGADSDQEGKIAQADGGTLFLDEIGDMPIELQGKLLRVLEQKTVTALGSTVEQPVDFRIICATNADLQQGIRDGSFRKDLYYRLRVSVIHMPPLRERVSDIAMLVRHFVKQAVNYDLTLSEEAERALTSYSWPGNVRELSNAVENARIICGARLHEIDQALLDYCAEQMQQQAQLGPNLDPELDADIIQQIDRALEDLIDSRDHLPGEDTTNLAQWLEERLVDVAMRLTDNNKSHAARLIGMNRRALQRRIQRFRTNASGHE